MTNRPYLYMLDEDKNPVPVPNKDRGVWENWFKTADRILARIYTNKLVVSTVFLGIDHNHTGIGPPILWETMVFPVIGFPDGVGPAVEEFGQRRYASKEEALAGHAEVVEQVKNSVVVIVKKDKE